MEDVQLDFHYRSVKNSRTIFPGITTNIPLKITNKGNSQNFTLKAMDDLGFINSLVPNDQFVAANGAAEFSLAVRAPANASSGETSTVTVYVTPTFSDNISNYMVFYVSVTTKVSVTLRTVRVQLDLVKAIPILTPSNSLLLLLGELKFAA